MNETTEKKLAAGFSVASNAVIIILKFIVGFLSGSISVISEAIHSLSDFFASLIALFSVSRSSLPADKDHPFGHGRYEDMSGFVEGLLIIAAAFYIVYEAAKKLAFGAVQDVQPIMGIYVMGFAVVANLVVSTYLFKVAKKTDSMSLYADGEHLRTDIYSSLGVMIGLILIKITGIQILDPLIAVFVAAFILKTGFYISKTALNNLLDGSLPHEEVEIAKHAVRSFRQSGVLGCKTIKTRRVGPMRVLEMTLFFPDEMTISECHKLCDDIEDKISEKLGNTDITIHAEPKCLKPKCNKKYIV